MGRASDIEAHPLHAITNRDQLFIGQILGVATQDAPRVDDDGSSDMAGHDEGNSHVRSVETEIVDQRFGKTLDGELGAAVGAVGGLGPQ